MRFLFTALTLAAVNTLSAQGETVVQTEGGLSALSLLMKGGPVMIPLAICSVIALTVTLERYISLNRKNVIPADFMHGFKQTLNESPFNMNDAEVYCAGHESTLAKVVRSCIARWSEKPDSIEQAYCDAAGREIGKLKRSLRSLKNIAGVAPLFGLLGTVIGMIRAFQTVALSSGSLGRAEMLAQGIYEAMVTTAAGLTVAIPAILAFHYLNNKVENYADDLEVLGNETCDLLRHHQQPDVHHNDKQEEAA